MVKINTINKISTTALALAWIAILSSQSVYGMEKEKDISSEVQKVINLREEAKKPLAALNVLNLFTKKFNSENRAPTELELLQIEKMYFIARRKNSKQYNEFIEGHQKIINNIRINNSKDLKLEDHLTLLGQALSSAKTRVFNEYLKLKEKYKAPYFPRSCYFFETPEDFIGEFYTKKLTFIVPEILMDKALNLDLRARIELADRHENDLKAMNREAKWDYKTPLSVAQFYKFAATNNDVELTDSERFHVLKRLFSLSEKEGKEVILNFLTNKEASFGLKHKLAHFGKNVFKEKSKEIAEKFIQEHSVEILEDAKMHCKNLTSLSKMGISLLHEKEAVGKDVTVAVCDNGFFKIIPSTHESKLMKQYNTDERSFQWKLLHEKRVLPVKIHDKFWLTEIKNDSHPYHGSEMSDLVVTISPAVNILPVALDINNSQSVIEGLESLAEDPNVHIISCSFGLPQSGEEKVPVVHPGVKESILKCLKNNKILVLGAGNSGLIIPEKPEVPERKKPSLNTIGSGIFDMMYEQDVAYQPSVISSLFEGEEENSLFFTNLILVGSSKANSLELHDKSVRPGNGPAQKRFVYADGDDMLNFFDESPSWGGTSAATAMVSGILSGLWSQVKNPNEHTATRVSRALLENTDINEKLPLNVRGLGKVNAEKALENLDKY
jgi:hypothetical protein